MSDLAELRKQIEELKLNVKKEEAKILERVGERMLEARKNKNITQVKIVDEMGINRPNYTNIETGKTALTIANMIAFCNIVGVTPNYLLGFDDARSAL